MITTAIITTPISISTATITTSITNNASARAPTAPMTGTNSPSKQRVRK